ncbi:MAG: YbaK/EbsC family protein [Thermoleophilaceae bacterium]
MTRLTRYLLPTEKEAPADADAVSHRLMVRAGLIRQLGAGMWTWLPAGWRAHRRAEQIIREEMDAIGTLEMLMPVLQPAELWQRSGRYAIDELFKLQDRRGAELVLAMTHEEALTQHIAAIVRSYRDLPLMAYHFQTKERDEPRPRAGVLRTREFIMKDAYSFDRDRDGPGRLLRAAGGRLRQDPRPLGPGVVPGGVRRRDDGRLRRPRVHGALRGGGERGGALRRGLRGQRGGGQRHAAAGRGAARGLAGPGAGRHPGGQDRRAGDRLLGVPAGALIKALPVIVGDDTEGATGEPLLVVVRGDHRLNEIKLANALGKPARAATEEEVQDRFGAPAGFIGPVGSKAPVLADEALRGLGGLVAGANEPDRHLRGVQPGRDFSADYADVRSVEAGDTCPGGATIRLEPAIEVGNIFKLGTRFSEPLGATYLDASGAEQLVWMGSYGIGPARIVAAAVEQFADEQGISWPRSLAPFDIEVVTLGKEGEEARDVAEGIYEDLCREGLDVLYDDRDASPGEKFADAELLGCPLRLTVGRKGLQAGEVEAQVRRGRVKHALPLTDPTGKSDRSQAIRGAASAAAELWRALP